MLKFFQRKNRKERGVCLAPFQFFEARVMAKKTVKICEQKKKKKGRQGKKP
jgi:hypothetical protein